MELTADRGRGYLSSEKNKKPDQDISVLPIDSIYTPVAEGIVFGNIVSSEINSSAESKKRLIKSNDIIFFTGEYLRRIIAKGDMLSGINEKLAKVGVEISPDVIQISVVKALAEKNHSGDDYFGDGKIDSNSKATQMTGNCWAHAAITSLVSTNQGKEFLASHVLKKDGIVAIHLPEAANNQQPKPKGDGVYTFTEKEIADGAKKLSVGDGDVTALMMAVSKYFKDIGEKSSEKDNMYSNHSARLFEILTGTQKEFVLRGDIPSGVSCTKSSNKKRLESIENLVKTGQGAVVCNFIPEIKNNKSINAVLEKNSNIAKDSKSFLASDHTYSLIGCDEKKVRLIESNNPKNIIIMDKVDFYKYSDVFSVFKF